MSLIRRYPDAKTAAQACAAEALRFLKAAIQERGRATFAISGGQSPKPMFESFAASDFDWSKVDIFWVDERCVPPDSPDSNYRLAFNAWLKKVPAKNIHRVPVELGPERAAEEYAKTIRPFLPFDLIHRGMGADAHTASLFPGDPQIHDPSGLVGVANRAIKRITLLPYVLETARHTVILATGADKAVPLENIVRGPHEPIQYPAQIGALDPDKATWFIDQAAAARL